LVEEVEVEGGSIIKDAGLFFDCKKDMKSLRLICDARLSDFFLQPPAPVSLQRGPASGP